jgi:hypothetical protein
MRFTSSDEEAAEIDAEPIGPRGRLVKITLAGLAAGARRRSDVQTTCPSGNAFFSFDLTMGRGASGIVGIYVMATKGEGRYRAAAALSAGFGGRVPSKWCLVCQNDTGVAFGPDADDFEIRAMHEGETVNVLRPTDLDNLSDGQRALCADVVATGLDMVKAEERAATLRAQLATAVDDHRMARIQHKASILAARAGGVDLERERE